MAGMPHTEFHSGSAETYSCRHNDSLCYFYSKWKQLIQKVVTDIYGKVTRRYLLYSP